MKIITILGKAYSIELLEDLFNGPKRFSDLGESCRIEKTRSRRLKELKQHGLIETTALDRKARSFIHYRVTERGKQILEKVRRLDGC